MFDPPPGVSMPCRLRLAILIPGAAEHVGQRDFAIDERARLPVDEARLRIAEDRAIEGVDDAVRTPAGPLMSFSFIPPITAPA